MSTIFNIGLQSLMAYEAALNVTSQNIANVNTPFYSREQVDFMDSLFQSGVTIGDVNRVYSASLSQNLQNSTSNYEEMNTLLLQLKGFEPMLDDDKNSVATYLNNALTALKQLDTNTSSVQGRSAYLQQLTTLINQFSTVNGQIDTQLKDINQQMQSYADNVNTITQSIAQLNQQIVNAPSGYDTSDLLNQREQQLQSLAKYCDFTTQTDSRGNLNISLNDGIQVVSTNTAYPFTTINNPQNPADLNIAVQVNGQSIPVDQFISSGQIQGTITYRQTLELAQRAMGRLSMAFTQTMNAQNKLGIDYNGNIGTNIFNDINSSTAISNRSIPDTKNSGTSSMTVSISDVSALTTSDYQLTFTSATQYTLTRLSDNTVVSSGAVSSTMPQTISADGFSINLSAVSAQAGDQYRINPTSGAMENMGLAITNPELLALAAPVIATAATSNSGLGIVEMTAVTDTTTSAFATAQQLSPPVNIVFLSASSYQLVNASDGSVIEGPITYDSSTGASVFPTPGGYDPGYRVSLSGAISAGDTFNINFNSNSTGDNSNGLLMENLFSQGVVENGSLSFIQGYRLLSSNVSIQTSATESGYTSAQTIKQQAETQYEQLSGVSLQEETVNLASYQQAYQASAQILQTAKAVFDDVMRIMEG